jgi:hypothetical protein
VAEGRPTRPRRERLKTLAKHADALLVEASHHDIDFESVLELLRERHDHIFTQGKK